MGRSEKISYRIKQFENSNDRDFIKAIKIYNENISVSTKTNTNDITFFADNARLQNNRIMYFLGLYVDDEIVGYVEAGYLIITKTIIIDYIVLKREYHLNSAFYPLFGLIQKFFSDELIDYNYIVTEVSAKCAAEADCESYFSKKMLQLEDFRIIEKKYIQPKLGLLNSESNLEFQLLIKSKQALTSIKPETYIELVKDIYYNHYLPWYSETEPSHKDEYKKHIDEQFAKIRNNIDEKDDIHLSEQIPVCDYYKSPECHFKSSTAGFINNQEYKNRPILLIGIPIMLFVEVVLGVIVYKILKSINVEINSFVPLFSAITALCTCIFTITFTKIKK